MAHPINDVENYLVIPNQIKIIVSPEVQNVWKESDPAWSLFLRPGGRGFRRVAPQMWVQSSPISAVKMCWELLIPKMNPGATCDYLDYQKVVHPSRDDQALVNVLMWIGRDGSRDTDTAAATVPMSVRIPVPKDNEDLIITVEPKTIRPASKELSHAQKVGMIRNAAEILINQEEFQSQDDRNKVITASLNERFKNVEALDPNEIVVDDPGPRNRQGYSTLGSMISNWEEPFPRQSYVTLTFDFQFIQATLWELRLPPWFIVTKNVHYPDPNASTAAT